MRTHSQAPINQDPCACLLGHWFPRQAVYLSCPGLVCVCVECAVVHVRVAGAAILGALRADQSALYPYMACHGASPYRREVPPLIFVYSLGIGDTYGGPRSGLCGRCQRST